MTEDIRIGFGSCRKQSKPQPIWRAVSRLARSAKLDAWLWLGDAIYGGKGISPPEKLAQYYQVAAAAEGDLLGAADVIDGVYDDHDYGINDGGGNYDHKEAARALFLDHVVHAPADSPRRTQAGGLYGARTFGVPPHQVKVLMLDTRYMRADYVIPSVGGSTWLPKAGQLAGLVRGLSALLGVGTSHEGDMLGSEAQWQWLEAELTNSSAAAHLILSSVQVLTSSPIFESWGHFPRSRTRLLSLLQRSKPAGALLLSGDVHFAELLGGRRSGLLEVTSSGLTHSCNDGLIGRALCGVALRLFAGHRLGGYGNGGKYTELNFGTLEVKWAQGANGSDEEPGGVARGASSAPRGVMTVRIHDVDGTVQLESALELGATKEVEAARWRAALDGDVPTIFDATAPLRLPIAGAVLLFSFLVMGLGARRRQRAALERRRALKKAA